MLCFPNCKINIGLYITGKRPDGYHNLETVFYPVKLCDALEIVPADITTLRLHGIPIAGNTNDNLVLKAYNLLKGHYLDKINPVETHLLKNIPMGAGLGGGSSDGAFMLKLLNDYFKLGICKADLIKYALQLGSDCPFFIENSPQYATGRGELMQPVSVDLNAYSIVLVCPGIHVSTAEAFKMLKPQTASFNLNNLAQLPLTDWKHNISNDFEIPVFAMHPTLATIKQELYDKGAIYAAMTGSGSTLFGIFEKGTERKLFAAMPFEVFVI